MFKYKKNDTDHTALYVPKMHESFRVILDFAKAQTHPRLYCELFTNTNKAHHEPKRCKLMKLFNLFSLLKTS